MKLFIKITIIFLIIINILTNFVFSINPNNQKIHFFINKTDNFDNNLNLINKNNLTNNSQSIYLNYNYFLINNKNLINKIKNINNDYFNNNYSNKYYSIPIFYKKLNNFYTGLSIVPINQIPTFNQYINTNYLNNSLLTNTNLSNYYITNFNLNNNNFNNLNSINIYNPAINNYLSNNFVNSYSFNYFINFQGISIKLNKKNIINTTLTITTNINLDNTNFINDSKISLSIKF
ncbi:MAG: hypothetical protein ACP5RD_06580 [bacterium]|jgi:hypothetical protein